MHSFPRSRYSRAFAFVLGCIAPLIGGEATAVEQSLKDCVVEPNVVPLTPQDNAVGAVQDIGNLTIMELNGDYDRGLTSPREQIATAFYARHPDQYDFLVVFTTFEFPTGIAVAFYNSIRNDTTGIGQVQFDNSTSFGSSGKLQGYIDMAAMSRYSFVPGESQYQFALGTLAHELMHRWGVHPHFIDANGHDSTDLIGQENAHWSYFADTSASVMYGSDWALQTDGKFHAVDTRHRYSPLDMYLAGFAAASEVPPFFLIRNGDGVATDTPVLGATSGGQAETITIDQVIAANGPRVPTTANAQKQFTAAMILLTRPGENVSPNVLQQLENYRTRFQQEFVQITDGRGLVRVYTQPLNPSAGLPTILHGSGDTSTPSGVSGAVTWLESQQHADGHWEDRPATAIRDTAVVLRALLELDPAFPGKASAINWLMQRDPTNLDQFAWKMSTITGTSDIAALAAAQNADGGYALEPGWNSSVIDTAAVGNLVGTAISQSAAQQYVAALQNADGSFGYSAGGRGRVISTLQAATLLTNGAGYAPARQQALNWILLQQAADGGIGGSPDHSSLVDTIETYAAIGSLQPPASLIANTRQVVHDRQQGSGDWGGSVYLTAKAALAAAHDQRANLAVAGALGVIPAQPHDGEHVTLAATIVNDGNIPAPATIARWYDGDPDHGGVQIGADVAVPSLVAQSNTNITQVWDTTGRTGDHVVWLVLDATGLVAESTEQDNRASIAVTVSAPSNLPDLTFTAADFVLTPAAFSTLPSTVHLAGTLHNVGGANATGAVVRLYAMPDLVHALAETSADVAGRSTAAFAMDFTVNAAVSLNLLVRVDPDNVIAEANEANNDANLLLPFGQSLDLEVTAADIALVEPSPNVGQNVDFDVTVHNRGTVDSPPAALHVEVGQGAGTTAIYDGTVQIAAGQSQTRRVTWRASQPGAAQLRVAVDAANQIAETREDNNNAQLDFSVSALTEPDLTFGVDSLTFIPTPALQGQPLAASLIVRNLSSVATGSFRVALYAADPRSNAPAIGSTIVASLAGSSDTTVTINVADLEIVGDQTLYAFIDADNQIAEVDETNNVVIAPLHVVSLPDLAVSVADMVLTPALPVPGQPVQAQITVRNLGGQDAHNVVVRLSEGDAHTGAVGADQTQPTLLAGGSAVFTWNWTLGIVPNSRAVTAIADPDDTVREGNENNNAATLPFDVQDGNFFANQRYISPNGDGVQDETAIVFAVANPGAAELDVVNGAQYVVRHFTNVALSDALRGQVIWDGRDDHGRIVPDGDYHLTAIDATHLSTNGPPVTVDNNASSALEAFDTPYGVFSDLLHDNYNSIIHGIQLAPIGSPLRDQMFGFWHLTTASNIDGLYRTETLFPDGVPVISPDWIDKYRRAQLLVHASLSQFAFSPDGSQIVAAMQGDNGSTPVFGIVTTAPDQIDAAKTQTVVSGIYTLQVLGFFDADTVVFGPTSDGMLQTVTLSTGTVKPWRSWSNDYNGPQSQFTPYGLIASGQNDDGTPRQIFMPRDPALAQIALNTLAALPYTGQDDNGPDYAYTSVLSPQKTALAVYERNVVSEVVAFVDLVSGQRRVLLQNAAILANGDLTGGQRSVRRYAIGWLEQQNVLLAQDAVARGVVEFSAGGQRLSEVDAAGDDRVGQYTVRRRRNGDDYQESSKPSEIYASVPDGIRFARCSFTVDDDALGLGRHIYDPTRNALFVGFGESVVHEEYPEGFQFMYDPGIQDLFRVDRDAGLATVLQQSSRLALIENADIARFPLLQDCSSTPPADAPALILGDGARIRMDGGVQTLSRGLLHKGWTDQVAAIWPDETRLLLDSKTFSSLLNSTTILQARTLGRGIELSGVATDRNFAYYQLDWAPIEQPNNWQALTPPSSDEIFVDEFLTWVPPQTGTFVIRLTVVDKAGNRTTTTASAAAFSSSLIDNFSLDPRYISPNGDGVQDQLVVKYRVRAPLTLDIHIDDANGNPQRTLALTYDATMLGTHEFDWDGRNDGGQVVPDGRYRLNVDGFAAWVTVDNTPPTFSDVLFQQPYQKSPPNCTPISDPVTCGLAADAPQARAVGQDTNLVGYDVEYAPKTGGAWLSIWDQEQWGSKTFRAVATDRAGNTASVILGEGEEQLILLAGFRYQPPPVTALLDVDHAVPPIQPVIFDSGPNTPIGFSDQSGQLLRVAVETAPYEAPDQWTQRGIGQISDECSASAPLVLIWPCSLYMDTSAIPIGNKVFVRMRGERADGSRLYSNQGFIKIGGIDPPSCGFNDGSKLHVSAQEHLDGPLASARLFTDGGPLADADNFTDTSVEFDAPATAVGKAAFVVGIDQQGRRHTSATATLTCTPPPLNPGQHFLVRPYPVVSRDQCDGIPGDQVALGFRIVSDTPDKPKTEPREHGFYMTLPAHLQMSYTDAITGLPVVLFDGEADESYVDAIGPRLAFSTAQWPEGSYVGTLQGTDASGNTQTATVAIPVLKHAPTIDIFRPISGSRVCAAQDPRTPGPNLAPLGLDIDSPAETGYEIDIGAGAKPVVFQCVSSSGILPAGACSPILDTQDLIGDNTHGDGPVDTRHLGAFNGISTLRLRAVGWSGGSTCVDTTIYLDSDVEFLQRKEPTTIIPIRDSEAMGISAVGDPQYAQASMFFTSLEPVQIVATVTKDQTTQPYTLKQADGIEGDVDVNWNGLLDGTPADDGSYTIQVDATDGCAFSKTLLYRVNVDSTPPALALTSPPSGASTAAAVIEISGTVTDNFYLKSWSLDYAAGGSSNWQNLASGTSPITDPAALATWSRGSLTGAVDIRLSAIDILGNRSETHLPLTLLTPAKLIGGAELQPPLFSPNADGAIDSTRLQLSLQQNATLAITAAGRTLFSGPGSAGTTGFVWDGKDAAGHVFADGPYPVVVNATDPNGVAAPEQATLTATIDNTPPTLTVLQPTGAFAKADGSVQVHTQDLHFSRYDLTLTRSADAAVVATGNGTQGGDVTLTALQGFAEGSYALHAVARDGAGNVTTRDAAFVLDTTPPTVVLSAPDDGSLIPAAKPTSVKGSVSDANLATWSLSVAPATVDTWTDLAHGTATINLGEILAWTPNLPDGSYRLRLRGVDQAGNTTDVIHKVVVDGTPPVAHISAPSAGAFVRGSFEVDGSATDAHFLSYRISVIQASQVGSGQWADVYIGATPVDNAKLAALTLGLAEDDYIIRLIVTDQVGLSSTDQVTVRIDSTPPPVPLNLIGHVDYNRDSVLDWSAVTASDLAGYYVYRGGAKITPTPIAAIHYVDVGAPEGHVQYYVTAADKAGNESAPSNTVNLYIDHTPPNVSIARPQAAERVRGAYAIVGTAYSHDDFKQYRLSVQPLNPPGASTQLVSSTLAVQGQTLATWNTLTIDDETTVRVHLEGEDTSGNIASVDVDVVVDNGPPAKPTGLTAVLAGADVQTHWNPNTESDLLGYLLYRDNVLVDATGSFLPADLRPYALADNQYLDKAVADGTHTYVVYAIDRAGNVSPPSDPATLDPLDNHPPSMVIEQPANNTKFETTITVLATSPDSDIAQVQFAWRAQGGSSWTNFGGVLTSAPYRVVWTPPAGTPYGNYQIRALAQDLGGRVDPAPPVVTVIYADLTPPDVPLNVAAHADADTVHVSWSASTASDLDGYRLYRGYTQVNDTLIKTTTYDDPNLDDGAYSYTVVAVDKYGNASDASNAATAQVFTLNLVPPYSPVSAPATDISGTSPQSGTIAVHVDTDHGSGDTTAATAADGSIALTAQALALGSNHFTLRVTDANGDISRAGDVWVDRGNVPAAPTGVAAAVADHTVNVSWSANTESDLIGYRAFRNGHVIAPDAALGETPTATSSGTCYAPQNVVDGDPQTYCDGEAYGSGEATTSANDPALELDWVQPRIVTAANLTWTADYFAASNFDVFAWSGHAWIRIARVRDNASASETVTFDHAYRTTRLRIAFRGPSANGSQLFELAEVKLLERSAQSATTLAETLIDGTYHYQVSALSAFAFESPPSSEAVATVGDAQSSAVQLSGSLAGNDATLTWTASASPTVARYDLLRNGDVVDSIAATAPRSFVDPGLGDGTYAYVVYAYDALNNPSAPSNTVSLTVSGFGPGVPVGLTVIDARTGGELDETWQPGGGTAPDYFVLRRGDSASGPFVDIVEPTDADYFDTGLTNGKTYWYTVEAVDAAGLMSGQSAPVSGTPSDHLPPAAPILTYPTNARDTLTVHALNSLVCGIADPDVTVQLDRGAGAIASATPFANSSWDSFNFNDAAHLLAAPDGIHVADVDFNGLVHIDDVGNSVSAYTSDVDTRLQVWAAHGMILYYVAAGGDELTRWELGQTPQAIAHPITQVSAFAVSADEHSLAIAGQYAANGGNPVDGVWLLSAGSATPRQVGSVASTQLQTEQPLSWSPDGLHLLVANADGSIGIADATSGTVALTLHGDAGSTATWNADGKQLAYARANTQGGDDVVLFTLTTQVESVLLGTSAPVHALAWSPANDAIAIGLPSELQIVGVADGFLQFDQGGNSDQQIAWTAAGRVYGFDSGSGIHVDLPGWFCASAVPLGVGANFITATALDTSNLRSIASEAIEVDTPTTGLPDLAIGATDIFFLPPSGKVGQSYSASLVLHNLGSVDVAAPDVRVTLTAPDGSQQILLPTNAFAALAGGTAEEVSYNLGTLTQPGAYRLDAVADPDEQLREISESNNAASATLTLSADGKPVLELNLARTVFAPGAAVTGDVAVTNPGATFDGRVHLSVLDASNTLVADLGDVQVTALAFGQRWDAPVTWNAQGVFAGNYQLRAQLFGSDGASITQQTDAFSIAAVRHVQLALTPDAPTHGIGDSVSLHSALAFSDGNALLSGATLQLIALDPSGVQVWQTQQTLGTLLPGYVLGRDDIWPTGSLPAGVYTLRLSVLSPDLNQSTDATVTLTAAAPTQLITGTLAFDPGSTLIAGENIVLHYNVINSGSSVLTGVQARLRIVAGPGLTPISEQDDHYDLGVGTEHDATLTLTAPPLALISHAAILEARLPADASGQWRLLAQQGFAVVDLLPPVIGVLSPPSDVIQPAVVPFRATIVDQHSAVASAEVSVDSGNWQPVSAGADGYYARGLTGLVDGPHVFSVRARDTWGNQAQTPQLPFTVDATPPLIVISGVADGDVVNHPVTPVVTITDAHLATSDVRMNSATFISGTLVDQDGSYVLTARATDTAGNQSLRSVRFTIDRTAPGVAITSPQDGATVAQSVVHVDVQTESAANVTLTTGAYQATGTADTQGHAGFDNVPLALGANTIAATAVDRAGNIGGPAAITVTYDTSATTPLSGTVQPDASNLAYGTPLGVALRVQNSNAFALAGQQLRVHVLGPASALLAEQLVTRDFTAQEIYTANLSFDSTGWPLGGISVTLELKQAGVWTLLDTKNVTVVDLTPPLLALTAPGEGVIVHGPVALAATASDALSGIASVEASVDGGTWNALTAGAAGTYTSSTLTLADGDHTVDLRAHDGAGNLASVGPGHFTIDTLAPLINIAGVAEGDLLNHAVAPTVTIADLHLSTSDVRLNGQPYVSGASIATSGTYTLAATATDAAGNSSSASVHFTLDLDSPTIVFTSPAANATVATASIEVIGQTESAAHVHLSIGGFSVDTDADATGVFDVTGVPLTAGANTITAHATDLAGNVGPNATLPVTYQIAGLTGSLAGLAPQIARGLPLDVPYTLHNTGNVDFVTLPLRLELHAAGGGATLITDDFNGDIAGGADAGGTRELATTTLEPGDYTAVLLANMPAVPGPAGWITLDMASTRVFVDPCRRSSNDVIFADDFEGGGGVSGDEIFCNGFETLLARTATVKALGIDGSAVGAALWASVSDALPALRAVTYRVRAQWDGAMAVVAAQRSANAEGAWHRVDPRTRRVAPARVAAVVGAHSALTPAQPSITRTDPPHGLSARELP